jgi:hypothetical protein
MMRTASAPDLSFGSEGFVDPGAAHVRRIPQCFRSHRAMAHLVANNPQLFEPRTNRVEDNVAQWYPANRRPTWVNAWQYQKRQLLRDREQAAVARHAATMSSPDMRMTKTSPEAVWKQMMRPPAGSRVPSGSFPNSFGYSNGLVLEDPFYDTVLQPTPGTTQRSGFY